MKKVLIPIFIFATISFLTGCEKLKELTSKDVEIEDVEFESDEIYAASTFLETQVVKLSDWDGSDELNNYNKDHIKSVSCGSVSLVVYSVNAKSGDVKDFKTEAKSASINTMTFNIADYKLGEIYDKADAKKFVEDLIFQLVTKQDDNEEIKLEISGKTTNIPEGEELRMRISVKDIKVKIQAAT